MLATTLLTMAVSFWTLFLKATGDLLSLADSGDIYAMLSIRFGGGLHSLASIAEACVTAVRESNLKTLRYMAERDALTDLPNSRTFHQRAQEKLSQLNEQGKSVAVLMIDIDHFKSINDTYRHTAGDEVLRKTAKWLRETIRSGDLCARVRRAKSFLCSFQSAPLTCWNIAQRLHEAIGNDIVLPNAQQPLAITAGIGATLGNPATPALEAMLLQVDQALR